MAENGSRGFSAALVPVGLVITLIGAAVSYGITSAKVGTLETTVSSIAGSSRADSERLTRVETQVQQIIGTLAEMKIDLKALRDSRVR